MALPFSHRLHLQKEFDLLFKARNVRRSSFALFRYSEKKLDKPRLAVVVSKKVSKSSVSRHRIKRLILNSIDQLGFRNSKYDMLIIVNKDISNIPLETIKNEINKISFN